MSNTFFHPVDLAKQDGKMNLTCAKNAKNAQRPSWIRQSTSLDNSHHIEINNILQSSMVSCSIPLLESGLLEHITAVSIVALVLPACHFIN